MSSLEGNETSKPSAPITGDEIERDEDSKINGETEKRDSALPKHEAYSPSICTISPPSRAISPRASFEGSPAPFQLSPREYTPVLTEEAKKAPTMLESSPEPDLDDELPDIAAMIASTRPSQSSQPISSRSAKPTPRPKPRSISGPQTFSPQPPVPKSPSTSATKKRKPEPTNKSASPPKRKKAKRTPSKHPNYWLLDGNVVIQVGFTQFRLHRSRLAQHSEYFADIFDEGPDSHLDGYPLYCVKDVTVDDFEILLTAMDQSITYHKNPPSFGNLAALLRASHVLKFTAFREYAASRLLEIFSPDLNALTTSSPQNAPAIEAVTLGREYGLPGVLKRAFYEMLRTSGFGLDEESSEGYDTLETTDIDRLVRTRERLVSTWVVDAASAPSSFKCPLRDSQDVDADVPCITHSAKLMAWPKMVHTPGLFEEYLYDPLCGYKALMEDVYWEGYCDGCVSQRKEAWNGARKKMWDNLDLLLDLPAVN